jgi:DNA invertase Pin-like site-specific DNA recombinase
MRIGIYARVSTKDQSCDLQLRDLRAYCSARNFDLIGEYVDVGQSGAKDSRPELDKLMDDARKRQFDGIVVWRFDRFARSTKHLLAALEEFRSLGIQFISYQENMDTSSPLGQALFTIVSAVAQLERDLIRERVSAGIRHARANGKKLGRPTRTVDAGRILGMRAEGRSLRQIAASLRIGYGTVRARLSNSHKPLTLELHRTSRKLVVASPEKFVQ